MPENNVREPGPQPDPMLEEGPASSPKKWAILAAVAVILAAGLLIGNGGIGSTYELFNGETKNASSAFAGGYVAQSTAASATMTPSGPS